LTNSTSLDIDLYVILHANIFATLETYTYTGYVQVSSSSRHEGCLYFYVSQ